MIEALIYVHSKGGSADEVGRYVPLFPQGNALGFDYRARRRVYPANDY